MSLDLSWSLLDETFTAQLLISVEKILTNTSRPNFIGPISITALNLGNEAPEISIVDIGDVWQGFLDRSRNTSIRQDQKRKQEDPLIFNGGMRKGSDSTHYNGNQDQFAQFAERNFPFTALQSNQHRSHQRNGRQFASSKRDSGNRLQTFRQYSNSVKAQLVETGSVSSYDPTSSIPHTPASSQWGPGLLPVDRPFSSRNSSAGGYFAAWQGAQQFQLPAQRPQSWRRSSASVIPNHPSAQPSPLHQPNLRLAGDIESDSPITSSSSSSIPPLQARLFLRWNTSSLRMTINTSLLINHPSPAFMSLPLSITITGLVLQAGGLLAFEVDHVTNARKAHFCLVAEEEKRAEEDEEGDELVQPQVPREGPNEASLEDSRILPMSLNRSKQSSATQNIAGENIMPGEKILPTINLETSVGQVDKHVLRNVAKVERFVVTLLRKAIGDELVFPNFYSVELPQSSASL